MSTEEWKPENGIYWADIMYEEDQKKKVSEVTKKVAADTSSKIFPEISKKAKKTKKKHVYDLIFD